jgi:hypothetical protein
MLAAFGMLLSTDHTDQLYRALQKYVHEFHADRDHAKSNSQNRSVPVVQLACDHTASKTVQSVFLGLWCSQKLTVMPSASVQRWQHDNEGAWLKEWKLK